MEREPEEYRYSEDGKESVHTLADLLCHCNFLFGTVLLTDDMLLPAGHRKHVFRLNENDKGDEHHQHTGYETVMDTGVEHIKVLLAKRHKIGGIAAYLDGEFLKAVQVGWAEIAAGIDKLMTETWQVCIVLQAM